MQAGTAGVTSVQSSRYQMIDAWRGVAALVVVVDHVSGIPLGSSAVMLFFVISGYCITAAAEACATRGLGFWGFMRRRIHRIYPPYLFAVAWFVAWRVIKVTSGGENQLARPIGTWIQNLTLTQWLTLTTSPQKSPAVNPANFVTAYWSLNYEEQFYLVMALLLFVPSRLWRSMVMVALMPVSLLWRMQQPFSYHGIFIEYWLYFGLGGVVFWRLCRVRRPAVRVAIDLAIISAALVSTYLYFQHGENSEMPLLIEELPIVTWFAVLLIYFRPLDTRFAGSAVGRLLMSLGLVSYSLYLIHQSNLTLCKTIAGCLVPSHWLLLNYTIQLVLQVGLAVVFWYFCERPFMNPRLNAASGQGAAVAESG